MVRCIGNVGWIRGAKLQRLRDISVTQDACGVVMQAVFDNLVDIVAKSGTRCVLEEPSAEELDVELQQAGFVIGVQGDV